MVVVNRPAAHIVLVCVLLMATSTLLTHALSTGDVAATVRQAAHLHSAQSASGSEGARQAASNAVIDQIGGAVQAVRVVGDVAYVGVGPRLVVLDISDPLDPSEMGRGPILPGLVTGIDVVDDRAYATAGDRGGLRILDVSVPDSIIEVGALNDIGGANDVRVAGAHAFVGVGDYVDGDYAGALVVIDVSRASEPRQVGELRGMPWVGSVEISGSVAYLTNSDYYTWPNLDDRGAGIYKPGDGSVWLVDVSDPARPRKLSEIAPPRRTSVAAAAVSGNYLYYVTGMSSDPGQHRDVDGLWVYDASDPASPVEVAQQPVAWEGCLGAAVRGTSLYALCDRLVVFDVADPADPQLVSEARSAGWFSTNRFALVNTERLLMAGTDSGLHEFDVSEPSLPSPVATYRSVGPVRLVAAEDRTIAAVETGGDASVVLRPPGGLALESRIDTAAPPSDVVLTGGQFHVVYYDATSWGAEPGLDIHDLSDPANPVHAGRVPVDTTLQSVAVMGDRSYVVGYRILEREPGQFRPMFALELAVIDTETAPPELVSTTPITTCRQDRTLGWYRQHVGTSSGHVLLSIFECALETYRTAPSATPRLAGSVDMFNWPLSSPAVMVGDSAFLSLGHALAVVDLSDMADPILTGQTDFWASYNYVHNEGRVLATHGDRVFVSDLGDVVVVDIADRSTPVVLGRFETPGRAVGIAEAEGVLYVADTRGGLLALDPDAEVEAWDPEAVSPTPTRPTPVATATPVATDARTDHQLYLMLPYVGR